MTRFPKLLTGVFVVLGVLLFGIGLFWIGDRRQLFSENLEINAEFRNISGLTEGSKVLVGGFNAGEVTEIVPPRTPEEGFTVRFRVLKRLQPIVRSDSLAKIQMDGLVGNRLLRVEAGTAAGIPLNSGETVPSQEPIELAHVFHEALETISETRGVIGEVKGEAGELIGEITNISRNVDGLITDVGADIRGITQSGEKIVSDLSVTVAGVKNGRGTVGRLLTDESLYDSITETADNASAAAGNAEAVTGDVKAIVAGMKENDLAGKVTRTAEHAQGIARHGEELMASISGDGEEEGLAGDLRNTISNADEALLDLSENMESLKRNWFFRGFFKKRGFYDVDLVSPEKYRSGEFAPNHLRIRRWLHASDVFTVPSDAPDTVSQAGVAALGKLMGELLPVMGGNLLIVEGYSSAGAADEQKFLASRRRAQQVRAHLVSKYHLKPSYVGAMPMGGVRSSGPDGELWDGIALVLFIRESDLPGPQRFQLHPGAKR